MTNSNPNSRPFSPLQKFSRTALALPLILLLASCGGGGGGGGGETVSSSQPTTPPVSGPADPNPDDGSGVEPYDPEELVLQPDFDSETPPVLGPVSPDPGDGGGGGDGGYEFDPETFVFETDPNLVILPSPNPPPNPGPIQDSNALPTSGNSGFRSYGTGSCLKFNGSCYSQDQLNTEANRLTKMIRRHEGKRIATDGAFPGSDWVRKQVNAYKGWAHTGIANNYAVYGFSLDYGHEYYDDIEYLAGKDVTIGFFDSGLQETHPEISNRPGGTNKFVLYEETATWNAKTWTREKINELRQYIDYENTTRGIDIIGRLNAGGDYTATVQAVPEDDSSESHGTAVVAAAVGKNVGIATAADIVMLGLSDGSPTGLYLPITIDYTRDFIERYDIDILNLSLGMSNTLLRDLLIREEVDGNVITRTYRVSSNATSGASVLKRLRAFQSIAPEQRPIIVKAAGNDQGVDPQMGSFNGLTNLGIPYVSVVAVDSDGDFDDRFSNGCGHASNTCVAAPGSSRIQDFVLPYKNLQGYYYAPNDGTSFAAPVVSGGLALMKSAFRDNLSNMQLVQRLFDTANDDGKYSDSSIYGHGLIDLGAATNPWGIPEFMGSGSTPNGTGSASITASSLAAGLPLGDAVSQALSSQEVAAFDSLGAPFWFNAGSFTTTAPGASVAARLNDFLHPVHRQPVPDAWQFKGQGKVSTSNGHLALADGASSLEVNGPQGISATLFQEPGRSHGLKVNWMPPALSVLSIGAGYVKEHESLLGSQAAGAFGELSGETVFLSAGLDADMGRWNLAASGEIGATTPAWGGGIFLENVSTLSTSAFKVQASRAFDNGSTLRFSVSQPLRVHSGTAAFSLPSGRTPDGTVTGTSLVSPLSPSGQQLDVTASLELPLGPGHLSIGGTRSSQPRHQKNAPPENIFFTGYRATW